MQRKLFLMFALLCVVAQGAWAQVTFPIVYNSVWDGSTTSKPTFVGPGTLKASTWDVNITAIFTADWPRQGSGTVENPYLITSADE